MVLSLQQVIQNKGLKWPLEAVLFVGRAWCQAGYTVAHSGWRVVASVHLNCSMYIGQSSR